MIRVVLAVVLTVALFGVTVPAAERAEQEQTAATATAELEALADTAAALYDENDPVEVENGPAQAVLSIAIPESVVADGGSVRIADDELVWRTDTQRHEVDASVPVRVEEPMTLTDGRVRLSLVVRAETPVVLIERFDPEVETG
ncbi:MAG: hypothetical protein PPP58_09000 [Natronomonas sp.]